MTADNRRQGSVQTQQPAERNLDDNANILKAACRELQLQNNLI
jgi:hypothetical protein